MCKDKCIPDKHLSIFFTKGHWSLNGTHPLHKHTTSGFNTDKLQASKADMHLSCILLSLISFQISTNAGQVVTTCACLWMYISYCYKLSRVFRAVHPEPHLYRTQIARCREAGDYHLRSTCRCTINTLVQFSWISYQHIYLTQAFVSLCRKLGLTLSFPEMDSAWISTNRLVLQSYSSYSYILFLMLRLIHLSNTSFILYINIDSSYQPLLDCIQMVTNFSCSACG